MSGYFVINVTSNGAYVARFSVTYTEDGSQQTADSGNFTSGVEKTVQIPGDATDILLKVEDEYFINAWRTIFTQQWPSPPGDQVCYKIWGTTLEPHWEPTQC